MKTTRQEAALKEACQALANAEYPEITSTVVGSAYIPSIGSIKPRFSMAIGGERRRDTRFFASVDLLL